MNKISTKVVNNITPNEASKPPKSCTFEESYHDSLFVSNSRREGILWNLYFRQAKDGQIWQRRRWIKVGRKIYLFCWSKLPKLLHSPAMAPKTWRTKFLVKNLIGSNFNPQQVHWSIVATVSSPWGRSLKEWLWNPEILNQTKTNKSQQENKNKNKNKLKLRE